LRASYATTNHDYPLNKTIKEVKMVSENGNGFKVFGIGFALGVATGAVIALMYAPQPGKLTRKQIKEKAEKAQEKLEGAVEKAKQTATNLRRGKEKEEEAEQ
jgi:gas vesicle protein